MHTVPANTHEHTLTHTCRYVIHTEEKGELLSVISPNVCVREVSRDYNCEREGARGIVCER